MSDAAMTVWKLGEHGPDDKGGFEADCIICGERWPCESYRRLMDLAAEAEIRRRQDAEQP